MKRCLGAEIDLHTERVLYIQLQSNNSKQRCSARKVDQQVEVASICVEPLCDRPEDAHIARPLRCREGQNLIALGRERLGGKHPAILAGFEVPGSGGCRYKPQALPPSGVTSAPTRTGS